MTNVTYIGGVKRLKGKTALMLPTDDPDTVKVQFDDKNLTWRNRKLGFGWHKFPARDFDYPSK